MMSAATTVLGRNLRTTVKLDHRMMSTYASSPLLSVSLQKFRHPFIPPTQNRIGVIAALARGYSLAASMSTKPQPTLPPATSTRFRTSLAVWIARRYKSNIPRTLGALSADKNPPAHDHVEPSTATEKPEPSNTGQDQTRATNMLPENASEKAILKALLRDLTQQVKLSNMNSRIAMRRSIYRGRSQRVQPKQPRDAHAPTALSEWISSVLKTCRAISEEWAAASRPVLEGLFVSLSILVNSTLFFVAVASVVIAAGSVLGHVAPLKHHGYRGINILVKGDDFIKIQVDD
jgi:hypothetical protein